MSGDLAYLSLTLVTAVRGLRFVLVRTPWQPTYHVVYAAFLGVAGESAIIDIDHWRHYFLPGGALGPDGGLPPCPCAANRTGVDERPQANWRSVAQPG